MIEKALSTVESSVRRRILRGQMAKSNVEIPLSCVKPGTVLLVGLAITFEHSGVYLGDGQVVELHGSGEIKSIPLEQFRRGRNNDPTNLRFGDRIYAACSLSKEGKFESLFDEVAADAVRKFVGCSIKYDPFYNNCHFFSSSCVNHLQSLSSSKRMTMIYNLEKSIARAHGIEVRDVFWLPINIPSAAERFAEKIRNTKLGIQ